MLKYHPPTPSALNVTLNSNKKNQMDLRSSLTPQSFEMHGSLKAMAFPTIISFFLTTLLISTANSNQIPSHQALLQCLSEHSSSSSSNSISQLTFFPNSPPYSPVLNAYIRNLRFASPTTPKPFFILAATHISHIQALVICCRIHRLQIRTRSGGHDYEGFSYVSDSPFAVLDLFNLRSVDVNIDERTAWVESGATLGEVYFKIAEKSKIHGFPAGVCPTVGVGGHVSGGGYGNLIRKFGVSVDNVVDALIVDVDGRVLDRESMGEDLFWAIRGGGGASFGVIVSWKLQLVSVPEIVTVFKVERAMEENLVNILDKWQQIADVIDENLFIRVVIVPEEKASIRTTKAKFISLFLGNAHNLFVLMSERFPELGLKAEDCIEMSWIESSLFWADYLNGTSLNILLQRQPIPERFWKIKSDFVQEPIPKAAIEGMLKKISELKRPIQMTLNPYGGKMSGIAENEIAFPHRGGNKYKVQYLVTWAEEEDGENVADEYLEVIRELYEYMTPYVSKSPRSAFLNYRDADLGVNGNGSSYENGRKWGRRYFKGNFERLVKVKTMVDPNDFFRYEQSIPSVAAFDSNGRAESL